MDNGIFIKNEKELENLIQKIRIYNQDIRKKFSIEERALLIIKSGNRKQWKE